MYGSQNSRLGLAILEIASLLQSQLIAHGQVINHYEVVKATCGACFDFKGYERLYCGLGGTDPPLERQRDRPLQRQPERPLGRLVEKQALHKSYDDILISAFVVAIRNGWDALQHAFLRTNSGLMFSSDCCGYALKTAARYGRGSTFTSLLERIGNTKNDQFFKKEALIAAIIHNQEPIINILSLPAYGPVQSGDFDLAIMAAAQHQRFHLVRQLLRARIPPLGTNGYVVIGALPFSTHGCPVMGPICCYACKFGEDEFILEMIKEGTDFNRIQGQGDGKVDHGSPMSIAAKYNQLSTTKLLLDHGFSVKSMKSDAFNTAASFGRIDVIRFFCTRGLDSELFERPYLAFQTAVSRGHLDIARFLWPRLDREEVMRVGPGRDYLRDRCMRHNPGGDSVHDEVLLRALESRPPAVIKWLVNDCHFNVRNYLGVMHSEGLSPVLHAVVMQKLGVLRMLFELGADPIDTKDFHVRKWIRWPEPLSEEVWIGLEFNRLWKEAKGRGRRYDEFYQELVESSPGVWDVEIKLSYNNYWILQVKYPLNKFRQVSWELAHGI